MPILTILAGPNGAGKTRLTNFLLEKEILSVEPINLDLIDDSIFDSLSGNVYNYENELAKKKDAFFLKSCNDAISQNRDFAFECNLRTSQIQNVRYFEQAGYELNLVYLFLLNKEISVKRVAQRVKEGGHSVDDISITHNFEEGLRNLKESFFDWHNLYIINNSEDFRKESVEIDLHYAIIAEKGEIIYNDGSLTFIFSEI